MNFIKKLLNRLLPEDSEVGCGYGPFKLSADHPFSPACALHDWEFDQAHVGEADKPIDKVDWDLFFRWVLIAQAQKDDAKRCELAMEICMYWPLARGAGGILWDGDPKELIQTPTQMKRT